MDDVPVGGGDAGLAETLDVRKYYKGSQRSGADVYAAERETLVDGVTDGRALQDTRRKQLQQTAAGAGHRRGGGASTPTTPAPRRRRRPRQSRRAPPAEMLGPGGPRRRRPSWRCCGGGRASEAFRAGGGNRGPRPWRVAPAATAAPPAPPRPPAPANAQRPPCRARAEAQGGVHAALLGPRPAYVSVTEDGRSVCVVCNKVFSKPSQLRLHVNIHYFERPFRCDSCAVSFRTKGHLQKHERSVSHQNKVSMNSTFGTPTTTNPRPFKCDDCKIAFRIHGHLAKHLRSKMHIMKLECVGKLPFGTYAEMEREGVSLNEIDTTDCENSLESLQMLAQRLYEKDPNKLERWEGEPVPPISGGDTSSDEGEPLAAGQLQQQAMQGLQGLSALTPIAPVPVKPPLFSIENQLRPKDPGAELRDGPPRLDSVSEADVVRDATDGLEMLSRVPFGCPLCPRVFAESGALQIHALMDHGAAEGARRSVPPPPPVWEHHPPLPPATVNGLPDHGTLLRIEQALGHSKGLACDVCRMPQPSLEALQKHLLGHAQPRPYVCDCCDAGFSSQQQLLSHREMHRRSPGRPQ
ncbi:Protein glass [Gryllus bimaculatus]|nr:Protein glass [Gryllus bimaculatus]